MNDLLQKSENSVKAAGILIDHACNDAAVHCLYYALLQKMLHAIYCLPDAKKHYENLCGRQKGSTHVHCIKTIKYQIEQVRSPFDKVTDVQILNDLFKDLKNKRLEADYEDVVCSSDDLLRMQQKIDQFIQILRKYTLI